MKKDTIKAEKCYVKALSIKPDFKEAGWLLFKLKIK